MTYRILLSDREVETLGWLADRGYWPEEAYDDMSLVDGEPEEVGPNVERLWEIEEPAAWSIIELADSDPYAFMACCGGRLAEKLLELTRAIV